MPKKDLFVRMDENRTQQILINLLTNAIKFSKPNDTIAVHLKYEKIRPDKNKARVELIVIDSGVGISFEDQKSLFQPYYRSKDLIKQSRNAGGHGLGLSICQSIITGLGGTI